MGTVRIDATCFLNQISFHILPLFLFLKYICNTYDSCVFIHSFYIFFFYLFTFLPTCNSTGLCKDSPCSNRVAVNKNCNTFLNSISCYSYGSKCYDECPENTSIENFGDVNRENTYRCVNISAKCLGKTGNDDGCGDECVWYAHIHIYIIHMCVFVLIVFYLYQQFYGYLYF